MTVAIIGTGLIGGSFALALKSHSIADRIIGVDSNEVHLQRARTIGLIDEAMELKRAIAQADLIFLAIPVDAIIALLPVILNHVTKQIVADAGSTKKSILDALINHPGRGRFVATHPMWGTENSGPDAAIEKAFSGKAAVICDKHQTDSDALKTVENIYQRVGMKLIYMDADDHDTHVAYVSHISHISSFALANTVLEKEKEEDAIFNLASAGFESTVRLAKSNPRTWASIFMQNRENILDVLSEHISQLRKFKSCLEKENVDYLLELMENANSIKRILHVETEKRKAEKGPVQQIKIIQEQKRFNHIV